MNYKAELVEYIELIASRSASDLHLSVNIPPTYRLYRKLIPLVQKDNLTKEDTMQFLKLLVEKEQIEKFEYRRSLLFSYTHQLVNGKKARFRGTAFYQRGNVSIALRLVKDPNKTIEELNLPSILHTICTSPQGLFLIVGPAGHGKSTTLAAMIEEINKTQHKHILTIENPIEFIFEDKESIISQREIPMDALSFRAAIDTSLRADADVVMVGEMRESETIRSVITAAEVGHLVLSTVHTNGAAQTVYRIIDSFPANQQAQIRFQLAQSLLGVFSMRLIPRHPEGLIPVYELLLNNSAVANLIRENRIASLESVIQTSSEEGMVSLNQSLAQAVREGTINIKSAYQHSSDRNNLESLL